MLLYIFFMEYRLIYRPQNPVSVVGLILTLHFKPGSHFCHLNVLVVCFLVGVMSVIKKGSLWLSTSNITKCVWHFTHGELSPLTWKRWSHLGWQMSLRAYCLLSALEKDTWGYSIPAASRKLISCAAQTTAVREYQWRVCVCVCQLTLLPSREEKLWKMRCG